MPAGAAATWEAAGRRLVGAAGRGASGGRGRAHAACDSQPGAGGHYRLLGPVSVRIQGVSQWGERRPRELSRVPLAGGAFPPPETGENPLRSALVEGGCPGLRSLVPPVGAERPGGAVPHAPLDGAQRAPAAVGPTPLEPPPRGPQRHRACTPLAGLTTQPHCDACAHAGDPRPHAPAAPPPRLVLTRGRRRPVETAIPFWP